MDKQILQCIEFKNQFPPPSLLQAISKYKGPFFCKTKLPLSAYCQSTSEEY